MKKIICIMFISLCFFVSGCNSTGNNNIINNLSTKEYDDFIINTLIPEYGIADLTQVNLVNSGQGSYGEVFLQDGISDISFRDLNKDYVNEMIVTIKQTESFGDNFTDKYKIEVYTIENNQVIELESDIEDMPVLTWLEFNYNNNFNVFTKSYDEGEYLVIENYVNETGDGGMGVYLRMYKMEGNELILQRDCSNTIYYAMGYEYDYDGMTYTYNQTTLYSDISQEEGYDIYNFQKEECRRQFDNDVSQNMSEFDMGQIWSGYMENYYNAMLSNDNIYINDYMKEASLRQSGITDLFRMEYMPDSTSGGNITFYNYNGDYLSKFK